MAHPTPSLPVAAIAHDRGVFREQFSFPGTVVFRVYTCRGDCLGRSEVPEYRAQEVEASLWVELNEACPPNHGPLCPDAEQRLVVLVAKNRAQLTLLHSPR